MKSSLVMSVLALWVSAVFSSQGIPPPAKVKVSATHTSSYYGTQHSQDPEVHHAGAHNSGAQVSVHSKITAPQTGPTVTFSQTTYQKPAVHQQHYVSGQYGGSVKTTTTQFGQYNQQEAVASQCVRPRALLNFDFDKIVTTGSWYFPMIHQIDLNNIYRTTYGYDLRSSENINNVCLRNDWASAALVQFFGKNDVASSQISCKRIDNGAGSECSIVERSEVSPVQFYGVKTDNKNYVLVSTCWNSGENGWVLFSATPTISYSLKQEILAEVRALGFESVDTKELPYTSCGIQQSQYGGSIKTTTTQFGQYNQKETVASQCVRPRALLNFDFDKIVTVGSWYFPMIHQVDLNNIYRTTYGYDLRSSENINNVCLRNDWVSNTLVQFFGKNDIASSQITCKRIDNGAGSECSAVTPVQFYGVKTDNKNYVLVSTCWNSGENGWVLFSATPTISYSLKQEILAEVRALGFESVDTKELSYTSCGIQQQNVVNTFGQTNTYETKVKETVNYYGQRPQTTAFTQTQQTVRPVQSYVTETKAVYQPNTQYVAQKNVVTKYANCKIPVDYQLAQITWKSNTDSFYYPLIHENDYNNFYKIVFGRELRSNEDVNAQCLHNHWSVKNRGISSVGTSVNSVNELIYTIAGNGKTSEQVVCKQIGTKWAYECNPVQGEAFRMYTVKTDSTKYALSYTCWESGVTGWTLYSDTPTVTSATKQDILRQVRTLGFSDTSDIFELNYNTCGAPQVQQSAQIFSGNNQVYQQNQQNTYGQNKFVSSETTLYANCKVPTDYQLVDLRWASKNEVFYYPLIHSTDYNAFYKAVFGRDLQANDDTNTICLNTRWNYQSPNSLSNSIYNLYSAEKTAKAIRCQQIGTKFAYECTTELGQNYRQYVLKSDNRNWAFSYTCWESGLTSWNVISETPTIPQYTKQDILRKVVTLGFEADDYLDISYDACNKDVLTKPLTTFTSTVQQAKPATTFGSYVQQTKPATTFTTTVQQTKPATTFGSYVQQTKPATTFTTTVQQTKPATSFTSTVQNKYVSTETTLYANCKVPSDYQLVDLRWGSQNEVFYYPLIHSTDYNAFYKAVFGRDLQANDDTNSICLNTRWNYQSPNSLTNSIYTLYSAEKTAKVIKCKQIGTKFAYECTTDFGQNYRQYVLKSDNRNWAFSYTCYESGLTSWNVISETPTIPQYTKQDILRKVVTLGFEADDYLDISYDGCTKQVLTKPVTSFTSTVQQTKPATTFGSYVQQTKPATTFTTTTVKETKPATTFGSYVQQTKPATTFTTTTVQETKPATTFGSYYQQTKPATTFGSTVQQTKPVATFTNTVQQTKPTVTATFTQERQTNTYVRPVINQQTSTFVQRQPLDYQQTTTVVKQPVVHTTTILNQAPVHSTTVVKQQPYVQTTTFTQQRPTTVQETTTFVKTPAVQTTTFAQQQTTQYKETTTYVQKPAVQTTAFTGNQRVNSGYYQPSVVKTNVVYSGVRAAKYQHCSIPPLSEIADSPLAETQGVRDQAELTVQEQYLYFPLSQRLTLNTVNKFVFGKPLYTSEKVDPLCYGSKFSWTGKDKDILITFYSKGQQNNRSSEQIVCRQEDSTKWFGECVSATGETFLAYVVREDVKEGDANGFIANFCWESGQTSWNFFSTEKTVAAEDKEIVLKEVTRLGYNPVDYVELSYTQCPRDIYEESLQTRFFHRKDIYQTTYGAAAQVPTASFKTCKSPRNYLKRYNFESSTYAEGVEYFDLIMMHESEPEILNDLLKYKQNFNLRRDKDAACYRVRTDYTDSISHKLIGFRDQVSDNIQCTQQGNEHVFNCASKVTGDSYRAFGIKSDSSTWELVYKCWESGKETWDVLAKPGTILTESLKKNILRDVEALGFNPNEYVEFDHDKCEFNRNLFSGYERDCDCCKVKKFF